MQVNDQFSDHGLCISALGHVMKLILCSCVLPAFINRICKHCYASDFGVGDNVGDNEEVYIPQHGLYVSFYTGI